jgi:hypothetical protein
VGGNYIELSSSHGARDTHDPTIADWIMHDLTTTDDKDRAVAAMSLMATMHVYVRSGVWDPYALLVVGDPQIAESGLLDNKPIEVIRHNQTGNTWFGSRMRALGPTG